jgi:hypothetical protein
MRFNLLVGLMAAVAVGVVWLRAGRQLTIFVDRFIGVTVASVDVRHLQYDGGGLRIGEFPTALSMTFGTINNQVFDLTICSDTSHIVILKSHGRDFTFGPRTNPADRSGNPNIYFIPEPGDALTFTVTRSVLGWPTPFEFSFLTRTPWWKRYVYYRLIWKKPSGAQLTMLWRYEQDYFARSGWTEPAMMWNFETGLLEADIRRKHR